MDGFLICFLFKLARKIFKGFLHLFEKGVRKSVLRKLENDDAIAAECEAYYSNARDIFGEEY